MGDSPQTRIICIIPARGGSKRLPRKNITMLAGKPLLAYTLEAAIDSGIFDTVCVSSEDDQVLDVARVFGAHMALKRPPELATDRAQVKDVCKYLLEHFISQDSPYGEFAVLLPTSPLRTAEDVKSAYQTFKHEDANYLMSLAPYAHPPQRAVCISDGYVKPYFGSQFLKQTQLLEPLYRHDGSIIIAKSDAFLREGEFYGSGVIPYYVPKERAVDIDSQLDLDWAEFLLSRNNMK